MVLASQAIPHVKETTMTVRDAMPTSTDSPAEKEADILHDKDPADPYPAGQASNPPGEDSGLDLNPSSQPDFGSPAEAVVPEEEERDPSEPSKRPAFR